MPLDVKKLSTLSSLMAVLPNETYVKNITELAKQLSGNYGKICYVNLNKMYIPLVRSLKGNNIDTSKFFFIDGITKTAISNPEITANCQYVSAPDRLTEIGIAIDKVISQHKSEILLFDSLSTLLIYERADLVCQFVHNIVGRISAQGCIALFTCLEGEKEKELIKEVSMFVDEIVHLKD